MGNTLWDPNKGQVTAIDNIPIGSVTPAAGTFSALSATGPVSFPNGTNAASSSVTASTTHTLAGATQLTGSRALVNAANASDAVKLPIATAGATYIVFSVGSVATMAIFPGQSADTIDGGTAGASVSLTSAHRGAQFYCVVAGNWISDLIGAVSS
jgi:hypothetical protein